GAPSSPAASGAPPAETTDGDPITNRRPSAVIPNLTTDELYTPSLRGGPSPRPVRLLDVTPWAIRTVSTAPGQRPQARFERASGQASEYGYPAVTVDRKSTRLNSSHVKTSYAVFCLK